MTTMEEAIEANTGYSVHEIIMDGLIENGAFMASRWNETTAGVPAPTESELAAWMAA